MSENGPALAPALVEAYKATEYIAFTYPTLKLKEGEKSQDLIALLHQYNASSGFIITAHNPFSQEVLPEDKNEERTADLREFLDGFGRPWIRAIGRAPESAWPAESGFLVLGATQFLAKTLMLVFEQNAGLWCPDTGVPELIYHPHLG
jgi:hypothetical protein